MGADVARRLAHDGYKIAIFSSSGRGEALAQELGGLGVTGSNESTDDLKRLVEATLDRWGRIDAVVNSAGHGPKGCITDITEEQWLKALNVYFFSVTRIARLVTPTMVEQKSGAIVNISAFGAFEPSVLFPTS